MEKVSYKLIQDRLEKMSETLKAVAHPTRLQISNILMKGERSVGELVKVLGNKEPVTSSELSTMKLKGVLKSRRNGYAVYYSIKENSMKNIMAAILSEVL